MVELERSNPHYPEHLRYLYLNPEDQDYIFDEYYRSYPPSTSSWVFDHIRDRYPILKLERGDLHVGKISHYIGYLRGLFEEKQPKPEKPLPVQVFSNREHGFDVQVERGSLAYRFNTSEQRLVYNLRRENRSTPKILSMFLDQQREDGLSVCAGGPDMMIEFIDILLMFMERQVDESPKSQGHHWRKVATPYYPELGDVPTTLRSRAQSTQIQIMAQSTAVRSSSSSSSGQNRGGSRQLQSSRGRGGGGR